MKKMITLLLSVVCLATSCCVGFGVSAIPLSAGEAALNESMLDGECPGGLDYVYYAPQTEENIKYPLVVWLHGAKSGEYKRAQIQWYWFSNWASDEFQARFVDAGGAFLLLPRASNNPTHNWYASSCSTLKKTIDYFVSQYPDKIDTTRIYISGYSTGGSMVYHMASSYPSFFAAAMPIGSLYVPTSTQLNSLKDMSVWLFSCDQDPYISANTASTDTSFNYLCEVSNRRSSLRHTSFTQAVWPNGSKQALSDAEHYIWGAVTNDMFMFSGEQYAYSTTKDGDGNTISFTHPNGVINWLSQQRTPAQKESLSFAQRILEFIKGIFMYFVAMFK